MSIAEKCQNVEPMTNVSVCVWCRWPEAWVLGLFFLLAAMWVTKNPQFVRGWADLMGHKYDYYTLIRSRPWRYINLFFLRPRYSVPEGRKIKKRIERVWNGHGADSEIGRERVG